jgi:hypothetical protein
MEASIHQAAKTMQPKQEKPSTGIVSRLYVQSREAFYRSLPELLKNHGRRWVAFHGEELIGTASTQTELYRRCVGRGLQEDEFIVLFADEAALGDQLEVDLPLDP